MGKSSLPSPTPPRAWQRMLSGRRLDLLDPAPRDIEISDIALGLARVARWNGQTLGSHAFSVAQHGLLVEAVLRAASPGIDRPWLLAALLHDAPEYVIGDLISPFKAALGLDYKAFEVRLLEAIHVRFGLPRQLPEQIAAEIKAADRSAAHLEARKLAGFSAAEAETYFGPAGMAGTPPSAEIEALLAPLPTAEAQARFLARFQVLGDS
jgi:5'-deoxynucleotidase YfbR-like HD superfamily hydrolase